MKVFETGKEVEVLAVSRRLAEVVRDATIGLRDADVLELTGLSFATYQRMKAGLDALEVKDEPVIVSPQLTEEYLGLLGNQWSDIKALNLPRSVLSCSFIGHFLRVDILAHRPIRL